MNNSALLSIIVPVYKTEKYLRRCIDSLINQTYPNLEIIAVNDGSPDNCLAILREYEKKDKRVVVFDKENGGPSSARNTALSIANGEWVTFLDSDDWVDYYYYEELMSYISPNTQLVCGGFQLDNTIKVYRSPENEINKSTLDSLTILYNIHFGMIYNVWGKIFKKEIIERERIRFRLFLREDGIFLLNYIQHIRSTNIIASTTYLHYNTTNTSSITHKTHGISINMNGLYIYYNSFYKIIENDYANYDGYMRIINMDKTHSFCEIIHETYPLTLKQKLYWYKRMIDQLPQFTLSKYLKKGIHKRLKWAFDLRSSKLVYCVVKLHLLKLKLQTKMG